MTSPTTSSGERTGARRAAPSWASILIGYSCIVAGGLVAAVTGPLGLERGSWVAAYLVLVGGVAQLALGWVPGELGRAVPVRSAWVQVAAWNVGNALVIVGTLTGVLIGVDAGSVLLVLALLLAILGTVGPLGAPAPRPGRWRRLLGRAYLGLLVLLAVSIPVGIVLAHLR
ncbi:hypothetical protein [Ruania zhangjianzhongii]|uniref:hypothetical protein n=1 Tax=Ruania zhangjianzhongii TaxID=2603206 RepID=UPI001AEFC7F6|nr:hypothetical protein [Ruania zhangjianzhongii]